MANLKYSDKHNMVAFLKKPNESVGFTEVVDFLKGTSLRYALTHNPTIYDSLVKQFWQTATVRTLANGTQQLVASIDSKEYIITEASVRSKLQLADATGIHNLSDAEIYAGLATLGYVRISQKSKENSQKRGKHGHKNQKKFKKKPKNQSILDITTENKGRCSLDHGEGSAHLAEPHHTPVDTLPSTSLSHIQSPSHSPHQSTPHSPHQSPPYSPTHYSPPRIETLETELQQTKTTYGKAVLTLVKRVKILEKALKRKTQKVRIYENERSQQILLLLQKLQERLRKKISVLQSWRQPKHCQRLLLRVVSRYNNVPGARGIGRRARSVAKNINTGLDAKEKINTGREEINTGIEEVSTGSTKVDSGTASKRGQREGNAPMVEEEIQATHKTKEQMRQEEAGLEEAIKLQAKME
ncbi:hypothetical protein Tco_0917803 [Tanacetum coccineum]